MRYKYITGTFLANAYRLLRVFPNSDPIMGFVLPAAKNEAWWKAPLFAFATMFTFDLITLRFGTWTWVTSITYALLGLAFHLHFRNRKAGIMPYMFAGMWGVLAFDIITGPVMSTLLFGQSFIVTTIMQIPFTIMHLTSAAFSILIITPFLDTQAAKEVSAALGSLRSIARQWRLNL